MNLYFLLINLHYLNKGSEVIIPKEKDNQKNPDLIIDGFNCEIFLGRSIQISQTLSKAKNYKRYAIFFTSFLKIYL